MSIVTKSRYFSVKELECKCGCGDSGMDSAFMEKLDGLRESLGEPIKLSSAYRCPKHNAAVAKTGSGGPHTTRRAVDIVASGAKALKIVSIAVRMGFTGVGLKQHGPHESRFIHLDDLGNSDGQPRPHIWTY